MINNDVIEYAISGGLDVVESTNKVTIKQNGIFIVVSGDSKASFETFLNTPGLVDFLKDVDRARLEGFGVANTLSLMSKAKILFA